MNEISEIDQTLLKRLKNKIEQLSGLSGNADLSQKDFDFLLYYIQEKTGQALSLTTIKRIWRKEYQRLPHLSTLDMLAQLAYNRDWHTAKKQFLEEQSPSRNNNEHHAPHTVVPKVTTLRSGLSVRILAGITLLALLSLSWYYISDSSPGDLSGIQFSALVTADLRVPNSVVFSYDVQGFKADHFYIQQSWDPVKKVEVSVGNRKQTDIYYEPGYHYAKLMGNDRILKEIPVHIRYNDWFVRFRYPDSELVRVDPSDLNTTGHLGLKTEYLHQLSKTIDHPFQLGYMLSKDFHLPADEFQIEALVKFDSILAPSCPMMNLLIKGDKDYAWITMGNKGCESNLGLKVGDSQINGKTNDLSLLGMDAFSWEKINVKIANGTFRLSVNNRVVHEGTYSNRLGELKEIDLFFNGIGSIDEVRIADNNDHPMLSQSFN